MAPIATLTVRISAQIAELQKSFTDATKSAKNFQENFAGVATAAASIGTFIGNVFTKLASSIASGFGNAVTAAIAASQKFSNAFMGLSGVAEHFGTSTAAATAAARQLSADGMLPLADSVTGLKNLLASGFNLADSTKLMNAFKDSAAFGRQSSLSFGDAVRSATEGVKNQQNQLIDNAGVTKNYAAILKDAGYTTADMGDKVKSAGAHQALLNGILRETAAQAGDAAKASKTYGGAVAAVDAAQQSLLATWGDAITKNESVQVALVAVADALRKLTDASGDNKKAFYLVSDAVTFVLRSFASLLTAVDNLQSGFAKMDAVISGAVSNMIKAVANLAQKLLDLVLIAAKIPGGATVLGTLMPNEISSLIIIAGKGKEIYEQMNAQMKVTQDRSAAVTAALKPWIATLKEIADATEKARGKMVEIGDTPPVKAKNPPPLADLLKNADKTVDTFTELAALVKKTGDSAGFGKALEQIQAQLPKVAKGMEKMRDATFGLDEIKKAYLLVAALGDIENVAKLTEDQQQSVNKTVGDAIAIFHRLGITADKSLQAIYDRTLPLINEFGDVRDAVERVQKQIQKGMPPLWDEKDIPKFDIADTVNQNASKNLAGFAKGEIDQLMKQAEQSIRPVFKQLAMDLPRIMGEAFARGDNMWAAAGTAAADGFLQAYKKHVEAAKKDQRSLTGGEKLLGLAGAGISGFMGGVAMGQQGGKAKGALGGAASGAMTGFMTGGPVGAAVGGIAGLIGGLFGGSKKAKEERAELAKNKQALLDQYGGMKNLQKLAQSLGIDIQKAFDAKKPAQFTAAVEELNKAIEDQKKRIEGLNNAVEGLNKRSAIFGAKFQAILDAKPPEGATDKQAAKFAADQQAKLAYAAQASGDEFDRLGLIARDTFAGLVKENGNAIEAMQQMAPTLQVLQDGVDKFGLTASGVTQELIDNFKLVNDEAFKPLFEQISADGQVLKGLFDAKALSPEGFQAIAADIGASIQGIVDKGGDMKKTLALSQPVLQTLWEAQQQYGAVTDDTTKAILKQAEEQGLVGEAMKGTNEKILDILLAIGKVLGADLPSYFDKLGKHADDAATDIEDSFDKIKIDPIPVPLDYQTRGDFPGTGSPVPQGAPTAIALARGGIVRRPTYALVGEAGPEAVIPLSGSSLGLEPNTYTTAIYLDGDKIAQSTARKLPKYMRGLGVGH